MKIERVGQEKEQGRDIVQNTHKLFLDLLKITFNYVCVWLLTRIQGHQTALELE